MGLLRVMRCAHLNTRCIHGDEILHAMKIYTFRFWKDEVVRRQRCLDCGKPLDRDAICTITGENVHEQLTSGCFCSVHDITRLGTAHADWCPMAD